MWIDDEFPNARGKYSKISDASNDYNCIAWAAGDNTRWWTHQQGYRWPEAPHNQLVESLIAVFASLGYEVCDNARLEDGFDKVAIYAKGRLWQHASRQLDSGRWTSKLGRHEDIEHSTPDDLSGDQYGIVHCIMRKKRA